MATMDAAEFLALVADARRQVAERNAKAAALAELGKPVRMVGPGDLRALAGPDMSKPGRFRVTYFVGRVPNGHSEYLTFFDAVRDALAQRYRAEG